MKTPEQPCPTCGHMLTDCAEVIGTAEPSVGDFTLCIRCGNVLIFGAGMRLRVARPKEIDELPRETFITLGRVQQLIFQKKHGAS